MLLSPFLPPPYRLIDKPTDRPTDLCCRWEAGLRSGHGICVFANGERFEGEWLRDNISYQGKGALTMADGTTHDFS